MSGYAIANPTYAATPFRMRNRHNDSPQTRRKPQRVFMKVSERRLRPGLHPQAFSRYPAHQSPKKKRR